MPGLSRRELLSSGLALSASSLIARSAWGHTAALLAGYPGPASAEALAAVAPREQLLFDFGWKFQLGHGSDPARDLGFGNGQGDFAKTGEFDFAKAKFDDSKWRTLNLPHDWAVELPFVNDEVQNSHGFKPLGRRYPETSVGWYRRGFEIPASDLGRRITVEFDGAFRSVLVFVNGCFIGRNDNGYAPFRFDLTDFLTYGHKNYITLRVDASFGDGWFYEGAGLYRHVWLTKTDALHLGKWESTVRSTLNGSAATLTLGTVVQNEGKQTESAKVSWQILDTAGKTVATADAPAQSIAVELTPRRRSWPIPPSGRSMRPRSIRPLSLSKLPASRATPSALPLACAPPSSMPTRASSSTESPSRFRAPATIRTTPASALLCLTACSGSAWA
jgi:beta-galactosidase